MEDDSIISNYEQVPFTEFLDDVIYTLFFFYIFSSSMHPQSKK